MRLVWVVVMVLTGIYSQAQVPTKDQTWTGIMQGKDVPSFGADKKFKLTVSVMVKTEDKQAKAAIFARSYGEANKMEMFYTMIKVVDAGEWKTFTVEGIMKKDTKGILVGAWTEYNGQFFFDDFQLSVENSKGELQKIPLDNADMEVASREKNGIKGWLEGIEKDANFHAKPYALSITFDQVKKSHVVSIEGTGMEYDSSGYIVPAKGYTPQMGALVSMLNNLSNRVDHVFSSMSQEDIDYLMDEKANTIGALIMHLAAVEVFYQIVTFENRQSFNEEEKKKWGAAMDLGAEAREKFKGKDVSYYLDEFKAVRKKTLEELAKRDDQWLFQEIEDWGANNYFGWFHVMEHQSSHLGQGLLIQKRIPKKELNTVIEDIKH